MTLHPPPAPADVSAPVPLGALGRSVADALGRRLRPLLRRPVAEHWAELVGRWADAVRPERFTVAATPAAVCWGPDPTTVARGLPAAWHVVVGADGAVTVTYYGMAGRP